MLCRHCKNSQVCRPRGLCWRCYYTPGVREKYVPTSKYAYRGFGVFFPHGSPPSAATHALPGSPEKIAVLTERARLGQRLWHPQDAKLDDAVHRLGQVG